MKVAFCLSIRKCCKKDETGTYIFTRAPPKLDDCTGNVQILSERPSFANVATVLTNTQCTCKIRSIRMRTYKIIVGPKELKAGGYSYQLTSQDLSRQQEAFEPGVGVS